MFLKNLPNLKIAEYIQHVCYEWVNTRWFLQKLSQVMKRARKWEIERECLQRRLNTAHSFTRSDSEFRWTAADKANSDWGRNDKALSWGQKRSWIAWTDGRTWRLSKRKTNDDFTWQTGIGFDWAWSAGGAGSVECGLLCFNVRNIKNYHKLTT